MKQLYLDIKAHLLLSMPNLFIRMYNNQFSYMEEGSVYSFPMPCVFIEFISPNNIEQLGTGVQIFDPLIIRIHIGHEYYNGLNQEEDLVIFDLKDSVFKALQKYEPNGSVAFIRTAEEQDYTHTNVYHFVQEYTTNYIDSLMQEPVNGLTVQPPFSIILSTTYKQNG